MDTIRRLVDDPIVNEIAPQDVAEPDPTSSAFSRQHLIVMGTTVVALVILFNLAVVFYLKWCRDSRLCRKSGYRHVKYVDSEDMTESEMEEFEMNDMDELKDMVDV